MSAINILKPSSSENIIADADAGINKSTSSSEAMSKTDVALATWAKLLTEWGAGKLNNPETVDATVAEYFTHDAIVDATNGCTGLHSFFKVYDYAGLKDFWAVFAEFDMPELQLNFVASPQTEGEVWHHFDTGLCTHKRTGKKLNNCSGVCIATFAGAKVSKLLYVNNTPAAMAAMMDADEAVLVPQPPLLPNFDPAADAKAASDAVFALWAAGEFSKAETKQAALEKYVVAEVVIDQSSPAMPALLKPYTGHDGFEAWNSGVVGEQWELSHVDVAVTALKPGCVLMKFACDIKHKTTGKEAKGVVAFHENAYNAEGQYVYTKTYWTNAAAIAAIHAA